MFAYSTADRTDPPIKVSAGQLDFVERARRPCLVGRVERERNYLGGYQGAMEVGHREDPPE